jgi:hypothetical protein
VLAKRWWRIHAALVALLVCGTARGDYLYSFFGNDTFPNSTVVGQAREMAFSSPVLLNEATLDTYAPTQRSVQGGNLGLPNVTLTFSQVPPSWVFNGSLFSFTSSFNFSAGNGVELPGLVWMQYGSTGFNFQIAQPFHFQMTMPSGQLLPEGPGTYAVAATSRNGDASATDFPGYYQVYDTMEISVLCNDPSAVPEPCSMLLAIIGITGMAVGIRRSCSGIGSRRIH